MTGPAPLTTGELISRHLDWARQRGLRETSITSRRRALLREAQLLPGGLLAVTPAQLRRWRAGLIEAGLARRTVTFRLTQIRQFYAWAAAEGLIEASPAAGLPGPPLGRKRRPPPGRAGAPMPHGPDGKLIAAHLDYASQRGLAPGTIVARRRALARMAELLGCPLLEATPVELRAWRAGLELGVIATGNYCSHAHQFYAWAVAQGLAEANPAEGLPRPRRGRMLPRPIGEPELLHALQNAPPRIRPWLVLAGWAGLRAKEIALLRRECVLENAETPVILIARNATKGRDERVVPLAPFVLDELRPVLPRDGWVFRRADGQPGPNSPARISQTCNRYLHECGITATLHQLRHRFGTQAYRTSKDLRAVQEMMGHADPATTAGYAAYDMASAVAAVTAIPAPRHLRPVQQQRPTAGNARAGA